MIDKLGVAGERAGTGSTVLDDLLGDTFANEKTMRAQLALSSMPLDETYVLVELAGEREITRTHLQRIAARISRAFRNCLWTVRDGHLVVLVAIGARTCPGWDAYDRAERVLGSRKEFISTLGRNGLVAYASEPFEQISFTRDRYQQIRDLRAARIDDDLHLSRREPRGVRRLRPAGQDLAGRERQRHLRQGRRPRLPRHV